MSELLIAPPRGLGAIDFKELWAYRELFGFMVWRDVSVRYKQSVLGILWALLTPLITMVIFTIIFGKVAKIPTDGIPYPIFSYAGLLPWLFFSQSLQKATLSMVAERNLLTKIYFPRLIVPMAATLAPLVDLLIASSVLFAMMFYYQFEPTLHSLYLLPLCVLWAWVTAVGVGAWLSALNVYFRDVGQLIPFRRSGLVVRIACRLPGIARSPELPVAVRAQSHDGRDRGFPLGAARARQSARILSFSCRRRSPWCSS